MRDRSTRGPAASDLPGFLVHDEVSDGEPVRARLGGHSGPPEQPAQPGQDFFQAVGLGDVVVAARGDAGDTVLDGVTGGQKQHAHAGCLAPKGPQDVQAVKVGQHPVQDHRIGPEITGRRERSHAVCGGADLPALRGHDPGQHIRDVGLVVDDEDPYGFSVGAVQKRGRTWLVHGSFSIPRHRPQQGEPLSLSFL